MPKASSRRACPASSRSARSDGRALRPRAFLRRSRRSRTGRRQLAPPTGLPLLNAVAQCLRSSLHRCSRPEWKKLAGRAVLSSDRMLNATRGEHRDAPVDEPRHCPAATPGAGGARPRRGAFARGSRGAFDQVRIRRAARRLVARPTPAAPECNAADTGTHANQLSVIHGGSCRQARRTLSIVLDGEASAAEVAKTARHLAGCEYCARFTAVVAELKLCLRASGEQLEAHVASRSGPGVEPSKPWVARPGRF